MYKPFNQFLLRAPLFSFSELKKILKDEDKIIEQYKNPLFQEGIYIASPVLYTELMKFLNQEVTDKKEIERLHNSLFRYLSRMSARCTPFGLLAGCAVGEINCKTNIVLKEGIARKTRFDMYFLGKFSHYLESQPEVREKIKYFPNSSLYRVGEKYRYIEPTYSDSKIQYKISSVRISEYIDLVLERTGNGATFSEIRHAIQDENISEDEKNEFINLLVDSSILISELSPTVVGEDYFSRLLKILKSIDYPIKQIEKLSFFLEDLDKTTSDSLTVYNQILYTLDLVDVPYKKELLFQVDGIKIDENISLSKDIPAELLSTLNFLNKITPPTSNETLRQFMNQFYQRYENAEIPLMEALDPDMGIGYPANVTIGKTTPLFDDFFIPVKENQKSFYFNSFELKLFKRLCQAEISGEKEIMLTDEDILEPINGANDLPPTLYALFELIKSNGETLLKLEGLGGICGASLLTRFAHTNEKIDDLVGDIIRKEEELVPNAILAEIVYLPNFRVGNILTRPKKRKYEITYLSFSDSSAGQKIPVSDLLLSVKNGRLVLRSKALDKEIIPRLTSAHNYSSDQSPVYTFLCDMQQTSTKTTLAFHWGSLQDEFSFYPRVRYRNTILSAAYWSIDVENIKGLFQINDQIELIEKTDQWRKQIGLPEEILLTDGDNELYVNCESYRSLQAFFSVIKNRKKIKLTEFLFHPDYDVVKDGKNNIYTNECIVTFYNDEQQ